MKETGCCVEEARSIIRRSVQVAIEARKEANLGKHKLEVSLIILSLLEFHQRIKQLQIDNALIAGSIGPYGACQCDGSEFTGAYTNSLTLEYLVEWHRPRFECLVEAGCDLIAFETIPSVKEACALISLLSEYPETKAWLSFSCKNDTNLCNGDGFREAFETFNGNKQLVAIGVNCTEPKYITGLLKSVARDDKSLPFVVYSNDGSEWDAASFK